MNGQGAGVSNTKNNNDKGEYNVSETVQGASVLTGSAIKGSMARTLFTCVDIEVYQLS